MGRIITEEMIRDKMSEHYDTGGGETFYVGFNSLAPYYSIKEGGVTDWTGFPGSGKTELLLETLNNCNKWYGHKHLINMPDAGTVEEVIAKLMHKSTGKQFEEYYYNDKGERTLIKNRLSESDMFKLLPEILDAFKIYNPERKKDANGKRVDKLTPVQYWEFAAENKDKLGIFSAVIDSWKDMRHDIAGYGREDKWLEDTLSTRNEISEDSGIHFHTIIHPKGARKDSKGNVIPLDMHDLKGGSEWGNSGKTIVIVSRNKVSGITDVKISKAKPRVVGIEGVGCLRYDIKAGRYYENIASTGMKRVYSHKEHIVESDNNSMPNNFDDFENDEAPF